MKGTRKFFSILTALALCLSLLPGTAWAVDAEGPGVSINNSPLVNGKQYVAGESGVVEKPSDTPSGTPYLDYNNDTLTVHGQMDLKSSYFRITGNVTITGGEGSCLEAGDTDLKGTLKLSGSVDFKPQSLTGNSSASPVSKLTTTNDYSGDIAIQGSSMDVLLDVQSSASIAMYVVNWSNSDNMPNDLMTLKSAGDINFTNRLTYHTVKIAGKNVSFKSPDPAFWGDSLTIQAEQDVTIESTDSPAITNIGVVTAVVTAGGNVTISSHNIPVASDDLRSSLTVKNARNASITGESSNRVDLLLVPVTFANCGSVTVTDTGTGELLKEGVTVTSDCPWTAKTGDKTVTMPSGSWNYGGDVPEDGLVIDSENYLVTVPTAYKAGEGWAFYEPPAGEGSPAKLTLDNATYEGIIGIEVGAPVSVVAKGENRVGGVAVIGSVTVNEANGTLNSVVGKWDEAAGKIDYEVYGKVELPDGIFVGEVPDPDSGSIVTVSLTVRPGAELTIPSGVELPILDTQYLKNNGTIVNNGTVTLSGTAAESADAETVKSLGLTGSGSVTVEKESPDGSGTVEETYTNNGVKLLEPAGMLDLSSNTGEDKLADKGYKWEVTGTDSVSGAITSAKLTLAPGFNATSVKLPDATVTIETTGESRIGSLTFNNPQKTELTFSGTELLTVDERIDLAGGAGNTITVAAGAQVTANNGIYVGATGESSVTVNGILKAAGYHDDTYNSNVPAVTAGKVAVSGTGVLEVSGGAGVLLNGMSGVFTNLFTVTGDGRFTANCSEYNVQVVPSGSFPEGTTAEGAIVLGDEYMPDDCKAELKDGKINLVRISTGEVYSGALTIHKNHTWETRWDNDGDTHWHPCEFAGCTEKQPGSEAAHFYRSCVCTVCGYRAPAGTPDSGSSGGDSGGSSGGDSGGDSGGSSGGGSHETTYTVTVEKAEHGKVVSDRRTASRGRTVTLTVSPDEGYETGTIAVTDRSGKALDVTDKGGGTYTFIMPGGNVSVRAVFNKIAADYEACARDSSCPIWPFTDADANAWYHDGVHYCLGNGLMSGYGDYLFGPNAPLSRAQFAQILHNREGRPAVNYLMQFVDVSGKEWYAEAVHWAASEGVVEGYGDGRFGPGDNITREQLAVMLWRYAGSPAAADGTLAFTDADAVSEYAREALCWAVENGILQGKDGGVLDPQGQATRAEAAAMLMRYLGK